MRVLVVGGAGYIGSHTAKLLAQQGHEVVVYDNLAEGHRWAVQWGEFVEGDLHDGAKLREALREHRIDAVIHFAAFAYVGESVSDPIKYYRNNVAGTLELLAAMVDVGVTKLVFSSTCATYGVPESVPIPEGHAQAPINPYGETKLVVEGMLKWFGQAYDLDWVALRYFNASGASPEGEIGESHDPETHLIPIAILAALGQRPELQVFGTDYDTPDGTAVRDYIHVMDLADAHIRALGYLGKGGESRAFNVGTGIGNSVREVIEAVEAATGRTVPHRDVPRRAGDPPALVADAEEAKRILGWTPRYTDLRETVATAVRWHESM